MIINFRRASVASTHLGLLQGNNFRQPSTGLHSTFWWNGVLLLSLIWIKMAKSMRFRKIILILAATVLAVVGLLNFFAYRYFWYWRIWWFDNAMHFLGGVAFGLIGCWLFFSLWRHRPPEDIPVTVRTILPISFFSALGVGSVWELFELSLDRILGPQLKLKTLHFLEVNSSDVLTDTLFDLLGGILIGLLIVWVWNARKSKSILSVEQKP